MKFLLLLFLAFSSIAEETTPRSTPYSRVYVLAEVNLLGFEWTDLGLERESQFTTPLLNSWEKWLKENRPKSVEDTVVCEADCLSYHSLWEEKTPGELVSSPDQRFSDALWLKISLTIRRTLQDGIQVYSWDGRLLLQDANTKFSLMNVELPRETKEWLNQTQAEVNTGLVSRVYKTPLGAFPQVVQKIENSLPFNRVIRLVIVGHKNLSDVTRLVEVLQSRGSSLGLQMEMSEFGSQSAVMKVFFRGEEKSFTDFLSQVKELKSSYNYSLVNETTDAGPVIRMVKQ